MLGARHLAMRHALQRTRRAACGRAPAKALTTHVARRAVRLGKGRVAREDERWAVEREQPLDDTLE